MTRVTTRELLMAADVHLRVVQETRLELARHATEPAVALLPEGVLRIAWSHQAPGGRQLIGVADVAHSLDASVVPEVVSVDPTTPPSRDSASWPVVTSRGLMWLERSDDAGRIVFWSHADGRKVVFAPNAPLGRIACVEDAVGTMVTTEVWSGHTSEVVLLHLGAGCDRVEEVAQLSTAQQGLALRPTIVAVDNGCLVAWEQQHRGGISIQGALVVDGGVRWRGTLVQTGGFDQAPSLCASGDDVWLGYNSDSRGSATSDLVRRVHLRRVEVADHDVRVGSSTAMPGVDPEATGEDQSLEFPALTMTNDGAVWCLARPSHSYRAARFDDGRWSDPLDLCPVLWGCRGNRLNLLCDEDQVVAVAHDRKGITIRRLRTGAREVEDPGGDERSTASEGSTLPTLVAGVDQPLAAGWKTRPTFHDWSGFVGDIHFHSACSDGLGTVEEAYLRCRDRYGHDFACLTEHDAFLGRRVTQSVWQRMMDVADAFHAPEAGFATLIAIEFTGTRFPGPGHKCVYFEDRAPLVCKDDHLDDPVAHLERLRELGAIAIPHHVGWLGGDPEHHEPQLQPCWEICSAHGQYEAEEDEPHAPPLGYRLGLPQHREALRQHFIRRRLEKGDIFGFVGGSDGHGLLFHHGISPRRDSHRTGLTGVWLDALGRRAILEAIRARRTWATSGPRMGLGYALGGHVMGSVVPGSLEGVAMLEIVAAAGGPIAELAVFLCDHRGTQLLCDLREAHGLDEFADTVSIDLGPASSKPACVYLRLVREDDEIAWASPVFWGH